MRFLTLTTIGLMLYLQTLATPKNEAMAKIRYRYAEIQNNLKNQQYVVRKISDERIGNDLIYAYFKNNRIELIVSETFGEAGKIRHEYYFAKNGELILASNQLFNYENAESDSLSKKLVKTHESKFFYQQKRLVKWMKNGKVLGVGHPDAVPYSRYMLGTSLSLTKQLKQNQYDETIGKHQQNSYPKKLTWREYAECDTSGD
jgi:hypothetical protein